MSSYLNQLAIRTLEQPPPIRPRLASLFEPVPGPRVRRIESATAHRKTPARNAEVPSSFSPEHLVPSPIAPPRPIDRSASEIAAEVRIVPELRPTGVAARPEARATTPAGERPPLREASVLTNRITETAPDHSVPAHKEMAPAEEQPEKPRTKVDDLVRPATPGVSLVVREESYVNEIVVESPATEPLEDDQRMAPPVKASVHTVAVTPVLAAEPYPATGTVAATPETPGAIRITIGRVDVRAIMPAAVPLPMPARPATEGNSPLSLDEYLKQRNGTG